MTVFHVGALQERPPGAKYVAALDFVELAPKPPLPKPSTLARWRTSMPEGLTCALVAPRETLVSPAGPMRLDEHLEDAMDWLVEAADALGARAVVLPTGRDLTTGQRDRDRLGRYLERLGTGSGWERVWAPGGLWEPEDAIPLARKLGLHYAFDPLEADQLPDEDVLYARLRGIGGRQRMSEGMLIDTFERLVEALADEVFVAIDSRRSFREAVQLRQIMVEVAEAAGADEEELDDEELDDEELDDEEADEVDEAEGAPS